MQSPKCMVWCVVDCTTSIVQRYLLEMNPWTKSDKPFFYGALGSLLSAIRIISWRSYVYVNILKLNKVFMNLNFLNFDHRTEGYKFYVKCLTAKDFKFKSISLITQFSEFHKIKLKRVLIITEPTQTSILTNWKTSRKEP
jgi:hypothetical protein